MNYTPLIEWAIATGRLKDGLPRACWVQDVVKDEQKAVASLLEAKATKRKDLLPPSPWREGVAASGPEYIGQEQIQREQQRATSVRRRDVVAAAASDTGEYPAHWLSRADHDRLAKARAKRG